MTDATPRQELYVVIDERVDSLDERTLRTIIAAVEVDNKAALQKINSAVTDYIDKNKSLKEKKKLHINELNLTERLELIKFISSLTFNSKVYICYDYKAKANEAKIRSLKYSVARLQQKHGTKKLHILIEHAEEYKKTIRAEFMTSDHFASLMPDVICHLLAYRLDKHRLTPSVAKVYDEAYGRIREHVRLHTYRLQDTTFEETRGDRL